MFGTRCQNLAWMSGPGFDEAHDDRGEVFLRRPMQSRASLGGDTDVAVMIARYTGATLGLFAFAVVITAGLLAHNPFTLVLSRAVFALFAFLLLGLLLGGAAQLVVGEYEKTRESEIHRRYEEKSSASTDSEAERTPGDSDAASVPT